MSSQVSPLHSIFTTNPLVQTHVTTSIENCSGCALMYPLPLPILRHTKLVQTFQAHIRLMPPLLSNLNRHPVGFGLRLKPLVGATRVLTLLLLLQSEQQFGDLSKLHTSLNIGPESRYSFHLGPLCPVHCNLSSRTISSWKHLLTSLTRSDLPFESFLVLCMASSSRLPQL